MCGLPELIHSLCMANSPGEQQREQLSKEVDSTANLPDKVLDYKTWTEQTQSPQAPARKKHGFFERMKSQFFLVIKVWELFDMEHNNSIHPYLSRNNNKSSCHSLKEWKRSSWQEQKVVWGWESFRTLPYSHKHNLSSTTMSLMWKLFY